MALPLTRALRQPAGQGQSMMPRRLTAIVTTNCGYPRGAPTEGVLSSSARSPIDAEASNFAEAHHPDGFLQMVLSRSARGLVHLRLLVDDPTHSLQQLL